VDFLNDVVTFVNITLCRLSSVDDHLLNRIGVITGTIMTIIYVSDSAVCLLNLLFW